MGTFAENLELELVHAFAFYNDTVIQKACFKVKGCKGSFGLIKGFFRCTAVGVSDLFVTVQDYFDGVCVPARGLQSLQGVGQNHYAALHVKYARPVGFVAFNLEGPLRHGSRFEDRIHMTRKDNERLGTVAELADQHIAGIFKFIKPVFAAEFGEAVRKKSPHLVNAFLAAGTAVDIDHFFPEPKHSVSMLVNKFISLHLSVHCLLTSF